MDRNFLKEEVFRAQDILKQIQRRFTAEYESNKKIVAKIQVYKEKLLHMEEQRNLALLEIEKHLSIIAKTNEELQQRLNNKDSWLRDADDEFVSQMNSTLEESKQPDEPTPSPADLEMHEAVTNSNGASSLENYLRELYQELCARVQAEEMKANGETEAEPLLELAEIKALLDEGDKRLQNLSAQKEVNWAKDDETGHVAADDETSHVVADDVSSNLPLPKSKNKRNKKTVNIALPGESLEKATQRIKRVPTKYRRSSGNKYDDDDDCDDPSEEPSQCETSNPKPIGPVRSSIYPGGAADMAMTPDYDGKEFGQGQDYFEEMFYNNPQDLSEVNTGNRRGKNNVSKSTTPPPLHHEYQATTSSAIGSLCILELNEEGKFVRLYNSDRKDTEIGNYMIKQNVGGHPVLVFRFPPRTKFPQNSIITIWAASCDTDVFHEPPSNYIWDAQVRWGVGPEYTTILCKPNGQAIAWTNAAHRYNPRLAQSPTTPIHIQTMQQARVTPPIETKPSRSNRAPPDVHTSAHVWNRNSMFVKREKYLQTRMTCVKHPYGQPPDNGVHPCCTK